MFYKITLLIWIISIAILVIILEKNLKNKYVLIAIQIYNFMTGFLGWTIYAISIIFMLKYSNGALDNSPLMGLVLSVLPVLLLLIPINIKVKKKINNAIKDYYSLAKWQ